MWQKGRKKSGDLGALTLLLALGASPGVAAGKAKNVPPAKAPELALAPEERTLETLSRGLAAVGVAAGQFVALSSESGAERQAIVGTFDPSGKTRVATFGKLTDQTRREIFKDGEVPYQLDWRAVDLTTTRPLFLDGESLTLHEADPKTFASIMRRSIPWDLAKPPRDTGGEPTTPETELLRGQFKAAFRATLGVKAAGMAPVPPSWGSAKKRNYLMALRVKGFPLALVECDPDESSSCILTRHCRVEGAGDLAPEAIAGVGVRAKDRVVVLGDAKGHRLVYFKFHSCLHVSRRGERGIPGEIKDLSNVMVDADARLWLTTKRPDDYQNASLFYWPAGAW